MSCNYYILIIIMQFPWALCLKKSNKILLMYSGYVNFIKIIIIILIFSLVYKLYLFKNCTNKIINKHTFNFNVRVLCKQGISGA